MEIKQSQKGGLTIFALSGKLDALNADEVEETIGKAIDQGATKVLVNLAGVDYISSAGLRIVLRLENKLKKQQGQFILSNLQTFVRDIFKVVGFNALFTILDDQSEALDKHAP